ncbi:MAG: ThuA domain-containing protein [Verrucomicrobia bacterium]|nr:ThuA domain-containing protein [Verrucomicrobiota bacterium]
MKLISTLSYLAVGLLSVNFSTPLRAADGPAVKRILFFSKSAGFEHSAIRRVNGQPSHAENVLQKLGEKYNFEFTFTKDGRVFTPENLAKYDAFFFYTTGDLTKVGTDKNPAMTPEGKAAFLEAIHNGKGFIGTHSASDTFHSPNYEAGRDGRYQADGDNADPYVKMLGAEFIIHGAQQKSHMIVADPNFPGLSGVPADFGPLEEWYSLKNFASNLHVLLIQDTAGMRGNMYQRPPYPATWARMYGQGRVFYTNMGHREDVWDNPVFQQVLVGGINWAVRNVDADVTPNIDQVTPKANQLPSPPPPR